jgi:FKBP-type peptidyl-prolyl cis-trans isomerase SlpA
MNVDANSHLTLHYRITLDEPPHAEVLSTFGGNPATLVLGSGELAPSLERCLVGIDNSGPHTFVLDPGQAFGEYREDLVQKVPTEVFPKDFQVQAGHVIELAGPDGGRLAGFVKEMGPAGGLVDFNHPLAGRRIRFEVEILAVL